MAEITYRDALNQALAEEIASGNSEECSVYAELHRVRECSQTVACAVIKQAVSEGHANEEVLRKLEETVKNAMWFPEYLPVRYEQSDLNVRLF